LEEHTRCGGLGSLVAEVLMDHGVHPQVFQRFALEAGFSSRVGSQRYLRTVYGLDGRTLADRIAEALGKRPPSWAAADPRDPRSEINPRLR
jgi:transketolase C-terminal domain/subunit